MGAGILVSGVLLLTDVVRRLMPNQGQRRRHRNAVGTYRIVATAAKTAGMEIEQPSFLTRRRRSSITYLIIASVSIPLAGVALSTGLDAFEDPLGVFYGSPWILGLGIAASVVLLLIAGIALILLFFGSSDSIAVTWIIEHSQFGHIAVPDRVLVGVGARKDAP
jgi:hypothetical protein